MRKRMAICIAGMLVVACTLAEVAAQVRELTPIDLVSPYRLGELVEAGYRHDDPSSLLLALTSAPPEVSSVAAVLLSLFPDDARVTGALQQAAQLGEDGVAFSAIRSLQSLKATGWEDIAVARLRVIESPTRKIMLAGMLAQAGRIDGWPIVKEALAAEVGHVGLAIQNVVHFDGLRDLDTNLIDAAAELARLRTRDAQRLSTYHLDQIERALVGVNARRSTRSGR